MRLVFYQTVQSQSTVTRFFHIFNSFANLSVSVCIHHNSVGLWFQSYYR